MRVLDQEDLSKVCGGDNALADCMANTPTPATPEASTVTDAMCVGAAAAALGPSSCSNPSVDANGNATGTCNSDGGGGGGGKVICTEFARNGAIPHEIWMADIRYSRSNFSDQTMRGYHLWGIPFVRLMRKHSLFASIAKHPTRWFAEDIAYRMGVRSEPNWKGWMLREVFFRPICSVLGVFAKARDWKVLFSDGKSMA